MSVAPTLTSVEAQYGSDTAGLVWAYAFRAGQPCRAINSDEALRSVREPEGDRPFVWLHFALSNSASERWLRQNLTLPATFYESLRANSSTRVETADNALVAVVHDIQFFGADTGSHATVALSVDQNTMVSARTTQLRAVDRLRTAIRNGAVFDSPIELFAHLLRDQADVLVEIVREATNHVDAIEDGLLTRILSRSRAQLGLIRRRLVRLQRLLAPEPAAFFRMLNRPPQWLRESDIAELRRSAEELSAAVSDSGAVIERVRILQDELSAELDEATNRTLFILTVLTAIVAPFEFISQLFGMAVGGVPLRDNPHGFSIVLVMIVIVIVLGTALVRRLMTRS